MTFRYLSIPAATVLGTLLLVSVAPAQSRPAAPDSPYGGTVVEDIIARVNDQIITRSDYDRAQKELDGEARQHGATMQQISEGHKDLLRNLIDQQLWISKGKELGITGETELVNRLNEIRKQYNLASMEDLEKAAQEQGVSYEDFKAGIRNQIITQEVMRQEVGRHVNITPGEVQRYFEAHQQDYVQPESVKLSEILVSTGTAAPSATVPGGSEPDDAGKVAAAKAKADEIYAKLKGGPDFAELARTSSDGQTASAGGDLGQFKRGALAKVLEDATFSLQAGQYTEPIRTRQGYVILKVDQHVAGGVPQFKDVEQDVEQAYYMTKMEPAMRDYLNKMRDDAYIEIKPGFTDTGATGNQRVLPISYSAYTPPQPKKRKKVERTRFRETTHTFRQKSRTVSDTAEAPAAEAANAKPADTKATKKGKKDTSVQQASMKPGKREKIRFGKAPTKTLPNAAETPTEDAGATSDAQVAQNNEQENPVEAAAPKPEKTRFSDRARVKKPKNSSGARKTDPMAPAPPDASEVVDRQTQSAPLGLGGHLADKNKKNPATTTGEKTRYSDRKQDQQQQPDNTPNPTPIPPVAGAPAPAPPQ